MTVYSHSRIESFFQCPLKFKFNYIEKPKIPLKEGIEAFMGSRVHETIEYLYKLVQNTKVPSEKELIEYYDKLWKENWNENVVVTRAGLEPKNYFDLGIKCIKN
ncbi:PD-(D/E)XK nuclease family protein, partial [Candidatus Micrarchaeota archaeon]|nr:PD-(D/E)XK nuclease family protein [Candidatus Micrarchaeota archaeon]